MEVITEKKEDRQLLMLMHLSQLLDLVTGFGGFVVPLIIWLTQRDRIHNLDAQGKQIINFQISLFIYCIICIPLILFFGLGIIGFIVIGLFSVIFPIINAVKASNGETTNYPLTIQFLS
ncbi:DUF4870 domain-containing protein [Mesonia maritima]|uniref:DUF4870 domain-containing protein n=1 Tax=Mesonia maritima TaxID=1793873 RepID=A0ABU1KA74_9FLAO|nr:DUF4870 domain-containing protein [Mesonia maritima]MDR6302196.1 hypothetical protein [Mesonia maritima]